MITRRRVYSIVFLAAAVVLAGCASRQPESSAPPDPLEGYNRTVFSLNESVDGAVLKPVANLYQTILPATLQTGISNFFSNLNDLPNTLNGLLQGDTHAAANNAMRLLLNSTLGIGGFLDVATLAGWFKEPRDFGQTLAVWGMGPGSYFVIPLFGPSTLRDFPALLVDHLMDPLAYVGDSSTNLGFYVLSSVQTRAEFLPQEEIIRSWSPDFYVAVRNYYLSKRAAMTGGMSENPAAGLYQELN